MKFNIEYYKEKMMEIMKVPKSYLNDSSLNVSSLLISDKVKELSNQIFYDIMIDGEAYYSIDKNNNVTRLNREEFDELKKNKFDYLIMSAAVP